MTREEHDMIAQDEPADISMTVEEYLALEATGQAKHEYVDGRLYAMAGSTLAHDRIANNIRAIIDAHLGDEPCTMYGPDVRLRVSPTVYYYPDAMVVCDGTVADEDIEVTTPRLIIEVLSDSTERRDRGAKFAHYQSIAGCDEYLLVDAHRRVVERFRRTGPSLWAYQRYTAEAQITLDSIGFSCSLGAFYRRTRL